jgi:hypothetical protein
MISAKRACPAAMRIRYAKRTLFWVIATGLPLSKFSTEAPVYPVI